MLSRTMLLGAILAALMTVSSAQVVTSNSFGSSRSSSSADYLNGKSYAQWTVGNLSCYVAQDNGVVIKQCRNGLLGSYHPMTPYEEAIIQEEIKKQNLTKKQMNTSINSMNKKMQRRIQGMQSMMLQMQQRIQAAFGAFG